MRQEADNSLQLDSLVSSGISQHDSFSVNDQDTAGLETVGMAMMAPTNTTESRDVLLRSGVTTVTESENLNLSNVFFEHGDNLMCSLLENSKPATENFCWFGEGTDGQASIILHTGSPLRHSVRLNNTISADGISPADEDTLQK
jgi:hypothetical protein